MSEYDDLVLFEAFVAGFLASGEGYNGEILRDSGADSAQFLRPEFDAWLAERGGGE